LREQATTGHRSALPGPLGSVLIPTRQPALAACGLALLALVLVCAAPADAAPSPTPVTGFRTATGVATAFRPTVNTTVLALSTSRDGSTVYAAGQFSVANRSTAVRFLTEFDSTTGTQTAFGPQRNNDVSTVALSPDGTLYAGGVFSAVGTNQQISFAKLGPAGSAPFVVTGSASGVTPSGASLAGTVDPEGLATSYVFEYGPSTSFGSITSPIDAGSGQSVVAAGGSLTGLGPNTTYDYRIVATNAIGTTFGRVSSFTTGGTPTAPGVITQGTDGVGNTSATFVGQVDPEAQATVFTFEYGTTTAFGSITSPIATDSAGSPEEVFATATDLTPNTTYFIRLVATNASGTTSGSVRAFSTGPGGPPVVTTGAATNLTGAGATLSGTVDGLGEPTTTFVFEYGTTTTFGSLSQVDRVSPNSGAQSVSLPVSDLTPGTVYLYRLVATSAGGTTAGPVQSFTTIGV
jgi:hypothetical protein